jgi:hypothetical protein
MYYTSTFLGRLNKTTKNRSQEILTKIRNRELPSYKPGELTLQQPARYTGRYHFSSHSIRMYYLTDSLWFYL